HLTLVARDAAGYRALCRTVSLGQLGGAKDAPRLSLEQLATCAVGLECLTGCRRGRVVQALLRDDGRAALVVDDLCQIFGRGHVWIEVQQPLLADDRKLAYLQEKLALKTGTGLVATGNVHYATEAERDLQDVLVCIKHRVPLPRVRPFIRQGASWHLRSPDEMAARFAHLPIALRGVEELVERCRFDLSMIDARLPEPPLPEGVSAAAHLAALVEQGARDRYGAASTREAVQQRLAHELDVITTMGLASYFLIVQDIVAYAGVHGILCQARGSATGSAVCYCLGINSIDPLHHRLSFERFLSPGRSDPPDIDLDFPSERSSGRPAREDVIQYVLAHYAGHAALIATLITYQHRMAVRDVGMALGLTRDQIDRLATEQEAWEMHAQALRVPAGMPSGPVIDHLFRLCRRLDGVPRHLGQHPGGIVITARPLAEVAPVQRPAMPDRLIVQWDKDFAETAGLIKIDHLGLGMLAVVDDVFAMIACSTGTRPALHGVTCDDPAVYDLFCRSDTIGVFQLESRAQITACLPRLQPRVLADLAAAVALIRPGPIQGNATTPYLRRRQGREQVTYPGGDAGRRLLEPVLGDTYGVVLYQDQVIEIGVAAGLTPAEASALRRAMGSKRSSRQMAALRERLDACLAAHGLDDEARHDLIAMMTSFSSYGFVRGHSFAFGYLAYVSCWLKLYYPAAFTAATLNAAPLGFYPMDQILQDARRHGITTLPVDVRYSRPRWTVVDERTVRAGLQQVHGLGAAVCRRIQEVMQSDQPATSMSDLCARAGLTEKDATALARSGALAGLEPDRRRAIWHAPQVAATARQEWFPGLAEEIRQDVQLPRLTPAGETRLDYAALGLSPGRHVLEHLRADLAHLHLHTSDTLARVARGTIVEVAGQAIARQRPGTAQGMVFLSLSDEWGILNVVFGPNEYERYRRTIREEVLLRIRGRLGRPNGVITIRASAAWPLTDSVAPPTGEGARLPEGKRFR
ncbi:MAG TPA: error-prone DNA polymerase, partial [Chloroflexota bacterium]|nr:error-prone DNA polymerase [Chloroflexota bacterium]